MTLSWPVIRAVDSCQLLPIAMARTFDRRDAGYGTFSGGPETITNYHCELNVILLVRLKYNSIAV